MDKKRLVWIIGIIYCLMSILLVSNSFSQVSDDKAIFKDRLYKYLLTVFPNPDFSASKQQILATNNILLKFTEEFPNSNFADDAQFIIVTFIARYPTDEDIIALERLIERYPNSKIEDYTIQLLENSLKPVPGTIYMPYDLVLIYLKGGNALRNKNYNEIIKHFSEFIKRVDKNNPKTKNELYSAYLYSLVSYKNLSRKNEGEEIKRQMISLFPEKRDTIEKIWSSPAPK